MNKFISKLHYLTQDLPERTHIEQAETACEAGCKWLQYRCFSKADELLLADLHQIASICDDWGATLIVTDHIHLLDKADIQGVHIEDMNADFRTIRNRIGLDKTLGASANTLAQLINIANTGVVDYTGCGPFGFTATKPNDYPVLGLEGYREIISALNAEGISLPVLAVGGVGIADVEPLLEAGVYGIAVSAAVNKADNPAQAFKEIYKKLY